MTSEDVIQVFILGFLIGMMTYAYLRTALNPPHSSTTDHNSHENSPLSDEKNSQEHI